MQVMYGPLRTIGLDDGVAGYTTRFENFTIWPISVPEMTYSHELAKTTSFVGFNSWNRRFLTRHDTLAPAINRLTILLVSYGCRMEKRDMDCEDFSTWTDAQAFYESAGGPSDDPHHLDRDGEGIACEAMAPVPSSTVPDFDRDCSDFSTWQQAQVGFYTAAGGPAARPPPPG